MPDEINYDAVIADLEAKRDHLNSIIDGLRQLRTSGVISMSGPLPSQLRASQSEAEITHDMFFGMTIADAARKFLSLMKHTKSTSEIAHALERGGLKHASKNFVTTIRSTLGGRDDFRRVNREWGLAEWYRKRPRAAEADVKPDEQMELPTSAPEKKPKGHSPNGFSPQSLNGRLLQLVNTHPKELFTAPVAAQQLNEKHVPSVMAAFSKLLKAGLIERPKTGHYISKEGSK